MWLKQKVLVTEYRANERKKGKMRTGKRQTELVMLQLYESEGQKWRAATKEKIGAEKESIEKKKTQNKQ